MSGPVAARLPGGRLHLQHGPIDLVIGADGPGDAREAAFAAAWARFPAILPELVAELQGLRRPLGPSPEGGGQAPRTPRGAGGAVRGMTDGQEGLRRPQGPSPEGGGQAPRTPRLQGPVARAMGAACLPHRGRFVTPMAAVAGAVAAEVLAVMTAAGRLSRAYVNNGGDIALHLSPGQDWRLAIAAPDGRPLGLLALTHADPVRGVATSGRGGRSFSLGIADAVTVLAADAPAADVAATLIANAVNLPGHPAIARARACDLAPDSDLGRRLVTTGLGPLTGPEVTQALDRGARVALKMQARGLIVAAALFLRGQSRVVGACGLAPAPAPDLERSLTDA